MLEQDPVFQYVGPQGVVDAVSHVRFYPLSSECPDHDVQQLRTLGGAVMQKHGQGKPPQLILVVLPENATDLYRAIKQCVKSTDDAFTLR